MLRQNKMLTLQNQHGLASIEVIPVIVVFMLLMNYTIGFFGVIHSGILQSIAARNYAFETFRNRSNLKYLRDHSSLEQTDAEPYGHNYRYHGIVATNSTTTTWYPSTRPIRFTDLSGVEEPLNSRSTHLQEVPKISENSKTSYVAEEGVNPVWLRTIYGICVNSDCGG